MPGWCGNRQALAKQDGERRLQCARARPATLARARAWPAKLLRGRAWPTKLRGRRKRAAPSASACRHPMEGCLVEAPPIPRPSRGRGGGGDTEVCQVGRMPGRRRRGPGTPAPFCQGSARRARTCCRGRPGGWVGGRAVGGRGARWKEAERGPWRAACPAHHSPPAARPVGWPN